MAGGQNGRRATWQAGNMAGGQRGRWANKAGRPTWQAGQQGRMAGQQGRQTNMAGRPTWQVGQHGSWANKAGGPKKAGGSGSIDLLPVTAITASTFVAATKAGLRYTDNRFELVHFKEQEKYFLLF